MAAKKLRPLTNGRNWSTRPSSTGGKGGKSGASSSSGKGAGGKGYSKRTPEEIAEAKKRSPCAVCHQLGHWAGDPQCKGGTQSTKPKAVRVVTIAPPETTTYVPAPVPANTFFSYASVMNTLHSVLAVSTGEVAIVDAACERSAGGRRWLDRHQENLDTLQLKVTFTPECERFQFGSDLSFTSLQRASIPAAISGKALVINVSVVDASLPLLLSKKALTRLGLTRLPRSELWTFSTTDVHW